MNEDSIQTEALIQYLDGELSAEETVRLEQELKNSLPLQEKLERLRAVKRSVQLFGLREQVKGIHQEMAPEYRRPAPVISIRKMILRIAAAVVLVGSVAVFYEYRQLSPSALFQENYRPYVIAQNRGVPEGRTLESVYASGRPQEVIQVFRSIPEPGIQDYFLAGNAFLNAGDAAQAIQAFLALRKKNEQAHTHILEEDTEYYLAMSYLKNGEPDVALPLFDKIHNDPVHLYHDKISGWWLRKLHWIH
jgi:tetratricopeptide (TPR) repeat protein